MAEEESVFETLYKIDVEKHLKRKDGVNYLPWHCAWAEIKKIYPDASYKIKIFGENNLPYVFDENTGYMVFTSVTIKGLTHEMWLPVIDSARKTMKSIKYVYETRYRKNVPVEAATMFDINKAIMRCLVKNLAMFGLGLNTYAGEEFSESSSEISDTSNVKHLNDAIVSF